MAIITLDPYCEYRIKETAWDKPNSYTGLASWHSSWSNLTNQNSIDDDTNSFYFGQMIGYLNKVYDWSCRLSFTIPANTTITSINKLTVKIKPIGIANGGGSLIQALRYPETILSSASYGPNPQPFYNDTANHISKSFFYQDESKSKKWEMVSQYDGGSLSTNDILAENAYVYLIFDSFSTPLVAGQTYYIYFIPWYSSPQVEGRNIDYSSHLFRGQNLKGKLTITLDYTNYTVSYNANGYGTAPAPQIKDHNVNLKLRPFIASQTGLLGGTVKFNANGGSSTPGPIVWTKTATQTKWTTQANGTGDQYNSEGIYSKNASATLYAKWSLSNNAITLPAAINRPSEITTTYTVTLNANGGSCNTSSLSSNVTTNWSFGGWNDPNSGTYRPQSSYTPSTSTTTLSAKWNVVNRQAAAVSLPLIATRLGYIFKGWGTSATSTSSVSNSYTPSGNITLYAIWEPWNYTISYNANGGSGTMDNSEHKYGDNSKLSANLFTNESKSFIGWHTNSGVDIPMYGNCATAPYDKITENGQTLILYAIWSDDSPWKVFKPYIYHNGIWVKI